MSEQTEGSEEKAPQFNKNGRYYGPSVVRKAYNAWMSSKFIKDYQAHWQHSGNSFFDRKTFTPACDYPVEVFLDKGKISQPYLQSFELCHLARWSCPDCIPGVISQLRDERDRLHIILYANDQYIELHQIDSDMLCVGERLHSIAEYHFAARGVEYVIDPTNGDARTLDSLIFRRSRNASRNSERTRQDRVRTGWGSTAASPAQEAILYTETLGSTLGNTDWVENYSGFSE